MNGDVSSNRQQDEGIDPEKAAGSAAGSEQLPPDYEAYRETREELASQVTLPNVWQALFTRPRVLFQSLWTNTPPVVHLVLIAFSVISLGAGFGIAFLMWRTSTQSEMTPLETLTVYGFIAVIVAVMVFLLLFFLPEWAPVALRFLRKRYLWGVTGAFFLAMGIPWLVVIIATGITSGAPIGAILADVGVACLLVGVLAAMYGGMAAGFGVHLRPTSFAVLLVVAAVCTALWAGFVAMIGMSIFGPTWSAQAAEVLKTDPAQRWQFLAVLYYLCILSFSIDWLLWSWWRKQIWPWLLSAWRSRQKIVSSGQTVWRLPGVSISRLRSFLTDRLGIPHQYVLVWKLLVASGVLGLIASLTPDLLRLPVSVFGMAMGAGAMSILIVLTLEYLFVPKELTHVRVQAPTYIARPVVRAVIVLILLFLAWWVLHAILMQDWNLFLASGKQIGFRFADGNPARPQIGDFLFYAFALMTNASYIELQPVSFDAKLYTMFVTASGLLLLVVFVGAALVTPESAAPTDSGRPPGKESS